MIMNQLLRLVLELGAVYLDILLLHIPAYRGEAGAKPRIPSCFDGSDNSPGPCSIAGSINELICLLFPQCAVPSRVSSTSIEENTQWIAVVVPTTPLQNKEQGSEKDKQRSHSGPLDNILKATDDSRSLSRGIHASHLLRCRGAKQRPPSLG